MSVSRFIPQWMTSPSWLRRRRVASLQPHNKIVQGLWIGERLSTMERLSIESFLQNGHDYHLYVYDKMQNVPAGACLMDANEILPASRIFQYGPAAGEGRGSVAGFSNYFRYKLLLERGGYWADMDVVCLKLFDFEAPIVISTESRARDQPGPKAANAVLKSPAVSEFMRRCWEECEASDPARIVWGETGPQLVERVVAELGVQQYMHPIDVFCPIRWYTPLRMIRGRESIEPHWHAVHLSHEIWRRRGWNKDGRYPPTSIYEQLKARYL